MPRRWGVTLTLPPCSAGLLQNIDLNNRDCQALILAPTRELASQIVKVVMAIGDYLGVSTMVRARPQSRRARAVPPAGSLHCWPLPPVGPGAVAPLRHPVRPGTALGNTSTHARAQ